jgi:flagellar hook-length control protein FliK
MSITSLLFPATGPAGGLGNTPENRGAGLPRPEAATPAFSHWLQRAQPSAPTPDRAPAAPTRTSERPPSHASEPSPSRDGTAPPPRDAERTEEAAPTTADGSERAPEEEAPVPGELPGAWWLMLPQAPAQSADAGLASSDNQIALIDVKASGAALRAKTPQDEAEAGDTGEDPGSLLLDAAADLLQTEAQAVEAEALEPLLPAPATAAPLRSSEGSGPGPMPWVAGLTAAPSATGPGATTAPAPAAQQSLATPVHDPDFPEALAQSITVLTRQGIQEAKLHLNPAEMGTVSVHISVSGQQAQVDFAASASATRAALEASLSHLAAALHSAGLTLTGGGVSQDTLPRRSSPDGSPSGPRRTGDDPGDATAIAPQALPRALAGRLDLYA